ncbi:arsenate reductase (glutaredoxin) [Stappia taiwanensis]|uniref:Arsenate reductase n=1 Tax=Stappia taiwanensis TaxID=992267 RepID=A0A838XZI7_9HYPH|nr:arsenate reductase (glutaredoxin) [Stappia taiwanensis]MBA4612160.1 arsenate reductase (glutaredoxin) [Stappia taiwanensis]GGE93137.1 arsenate reductase [Stappia taiwanensis]
MSVSIWHNPRCSKSRQTLELLREKGVEPEVRLYLKDAPDAAEIRAALTALGLTDPRALMRTKEALYRELDLASETDPDRLIAAMAANPVLIERPVVFNGTRAAIGRPPEDVLALL